MNSGQSAGERLKKARQEKGLTLEDLHKKTRVHINILKAIEGEALTDLSPVYLKGFIKIYCKALGLEYKDYIPDYREPSSEVIVEHKKRADSFLKSAGMKINSLKPNRKVRNVILIALIVLFSLVFLSKVSGCFFSKRKERKAAPVPALSSGSTLPKEAFGGISLAVSAKERCLVFVKADGKVVFHRVLEKGRSGTWKAKERIELSLGNASAVEIIVNGRRFTNLGKRGKPLNNIVITEKDGLKIPR